MNSLKLTPDTPGQEIAEPSNGAPYGYGTQISLHDAQIDAVGAGQLQVGQRVRLVAFATVTSISQEDGNRDGKAVKRRSVGLQLTDAEVALAANTDMAKTMYPNMT